MCGASITPQERRQQERDELANLELENPEMAERARERRRGTTVFLEGPNRNIATVGASRSGTGSVSRLGSFAMLDVPTIGAGDLKYRERPVIKPTLPGFPTIPVR